MANGFQYTGWSGIDMDAYTLLGGHIAKIRAIAGSAIREMGPVYIMPGTHYEKRHTVIGGTLIFAETPKINLVNNSFEIILKAKNQNEEQISKILNVEILVDGNTVKELIPLIVDEQYTYIATKMTPWTKEK